MKDSKILAILICLQIIFVTFVPSGAVHLGGNCTDFEGRSVLHGQMYVPGPWICIHCICYNSKSTSCGRLRCSIPASCKRFRVGRRCCEFECLDEVGTEYWSGSDVVIVDGSPKLEKHSVLWMLSLVMAIVIF
ncbi:uncharacterized protein LOC126927058 isoform X2 [Bombus affinis]|uniref:uncharacterized protein LOC126927058 isoform X2 n=1 Tax=Bombus affinis TaxID=309941 RepID=UPI0021B726D0|nr:uncharacterized protein LOC126927058 isoform X2 [Bombus affinis]